MCGCTGTKVVCGGTRTKLRSLRRQVVTLYNTATNPVKKQEYKEVKEGIDAAIKSSQCPSKSFVAEIQNYVNSEYN
jgi:hypothetical protein